MPCILFSFFWRNVKPISNIVYQSILICFCHSSLRLSYHSKYHSCQAHLNYVRENHCQPNSHIKLLDSTWDIVSFISVDKFYFIQTPWLLHHNTIRQNTWILILAPTYKLLAASVFPLVDTLSFCSHSLLKPLLCIFWIKRRFFKKVTKTENIILEHISQFKQN